jgi:hypothetical protein
MAAWVCVAFLGTIGTVHAAETVREIQWLELCEAGQQLPGEVVTGGGQPFGRLTITNEGGQAISRDLLTLHAPPITAPRWALVGEVRYEGVEKKGLLEMWSQIDGKPYFSRTLAESGPMAAIRGTSDWRPVILPFYSEPDNPPPEKLSLNIQLPGKGTVWLSDLRLMQFGPGENPVSAALSPGAWWSERQAGLIGGTLGAALGLLGALIGTLAGLGRGRSFVTWCLRIAPAIGGLLLAGGAATLLLGQPWWVFYPLLLVGAIWTVLPLAIRSGVEKGYQAAERRKMQAMDVE